MGSIDPNPNRTNEPPTTPAPMNSDLPAHVSSGQDEIARLFGSSVNNTTQSHDNHQAASTSGTDAEPDASQLTGLPNQQTGRSTNPCFQNINQQDTSPSTSSSTQTFDQSNPKYASEYPPLSGEIHRRNDASRIFWSNTRQADQSIHPSNMSSSNASQDASQLTNSTTPQLEQPTLPIDMEFDRSTMQDPSQLTNTCAPQVGPSSLPSDMERERFLMGVVPSIQLDSQINQQSGERPRNAVGHGNQSSDMEFERSPMQDPSQLTSAYAPQVSPSSLPSDMELERFLMAGVPSIQPDSKNNQQTSKRPQNAVGHGNQASDMGSESQSGDHTRRMHGAEGRSILFDSQRSDGSAPRSGLGGNTAVGQSYDSYLGGNLGGWTPSSYAELPHHTYLRPETSPVGGPNPAQPVLQDTNLGPVTFTYDVWKAPPVYAQYPTQHVPQHTNLRPETPAFGCWQAPPVYTQNPAQPVPTSNHNPPPRFQRPIHNNWQPVAPSSSQGGAMVPPFGELRQNANLGQRIGPAAQGGIAGSGRSIDHSQVQLNISMWKKWIRLPLYPDIAMQSSLELPHFRLTHLTSAGEFGDTPRPPLGVQCESCGNDLSFDPLGLSLPSSSAVEKKCGHHFHVSCLRNSYGCKVLYYDFPCSACERCSRSHS